MRQQSDAPLAQGRAQRVIREQPIDSKLHRAIPVLLRVTAIIRYQMARSREKPCEGPLVLVFEIPMTHFGSSQAPRVPRGEWIF
jgi:hypothetical protein